MTAIIDVDVPEQVQFDTPFSVTVTYSIDDHTRQLNVATLSHMTVTPSSIALDPNATSAVPRLTIARPRTVGPQSVILKFALGASEFSAGTTAS
jgi:hypothetical protein